MSTTTGNTTSPPPTNAAMTSNGAAGACATAASHCRIVSGRASDASGVKRHASISATITAPATMTLASRRSGRAFGRSPTIVSRKRGGGIGPSGSARLSKADSGGGGTAASFTGAR
jgi:hypothetical protein